MIGLLNVLVLVAALAAVLVVAYRALITRGGAR